MARRRCSFFFFNDTATTEIYTLSLHDALPIFGPQRHPGQVLLRVPPALRPGHPVLAVLLHLGVGPVLPRVSVERLGPVGRQLLDQLRPPRHGEGRRDADVLDRKSTRLNSSHANISY